MTDHPSSAGYVPRHARTLDPSVDRAVHELGAKLNAPGDDLGPKHAAAVSR